MLRCNARMPCGHLCPKACHAVDPEHLKAFCMKPCAKFFERCTHSCPKTCHFGEDCGDCTVMVKKNRTTCNHTIEVECHKDANDVYCPVSCSKKRNCGHECGQACCKTCDIALCEKPVSILSPCEHIVTIECGRAYIVDAVLAACRNPCESVLECKHKCKGTCGECYQGRLHLSCQEKCERILICGHECQETCAVSCPPCRMPCQFECSHSKCQLECGEPCVPCKRPCTWKCEHFQCSKLCYEPCDREICRKPCQALLECSHTCIGVCGETCPKLCRICHKDIVKEAGDMPNARFIQLVDCGLLIEVDSLLQWLERDITIIQTAICPKCQTPIRKTQFVNRVNIRHIQDVEKVKCICIGNKDQNKLTQIGLYAKIKNLPLLSQYENAEITIYNTIQTLKCIRTKLLQETRVDDENLLTLDRLQEKYNIYRVLLKSKDFLSLNISNIVSWKTFKGNCERLTIFLKFLFNFTNSNQQISDATEEMDQMQIFDGRMRIETLNFARSNWSKCKKCDSFCTLKKSGGGFIERSCFECDQKYG